MSEFASAAMIRVLTQGMRELGLNPGPAAPTLTASTAKVDLDLKRTLLARATQQGGIGCLPLLGRCVHRFGHEPTYQALASASRAADLFERWTRLERYIHSRHRCRVLAVGDTQARLRHLALGGAPPPQPAEDLVVLGVLAALLESIGLVEVQVHIGKVAAFPRPDVAGLERAARRAATGQWHFAWSGAVPVRETSPQALHRLPVLAADVTWPAVVQDAYRRLLADLARPLTLRELAQRMAMPSRSLQRELQIAGLSYSQILAEVRCRAGAWQLLHSPLSIAEIGFLSGYSDQPHFTRDLQRRVGMTPALYRKEFAADR
jgi:AraC-like DNA-binding protein